MNESERIMNTERNQAQGRQQWTTVLLTILAIAGLVLYLAYNGPQYQYFPDITQTSRSEAIHTAETFLTEQNLVTARTLDQYRTALSYVNDARSQAFLQQSLGADRTQSYLDRHALPVVEYEVRFFRPQQQEQFHVRVAVESGRVTGVRHTVSDSSSGASLTKSTAQAKAHTFLQEQGHTLPQLIPTDYAQDTHANRTDHTFTYRVQNASISSQFGKADQEVTVTVQGDTIGTYRTVLSLPDEFSRMVDGQRGSGRFMALLSLLATVIMGIVALVVVIQQFVSRSVRWKPYLAIALGVFLLLVLHQINLLPALLHQYQTTVPLAVFYGSILIIPIIVYALYATGIVISGTAGDTLSQEVWPEKSLPSHVTVTSAWSLLRGYLVAFLFMGVTAVLYMLGDHFLDVWALPQATPLNMLLGFVPAISVLAMMAALPAVSEELLYRFFGITAFRNWLRSTTAAIVITAIIWAVAHSAYPVFPFYFRAIELIIGGIIFGYIFVQFDILTTVSAHFIYNTLVALPLFLFTQQLTVIVPVLFVAAVPLIVAVIIYGYTRRKEEKGKKELS